MKKYTYIDHQKQANSNLIFFCVADNITQADKLFEKYFSDKPETPYYGKSIKSLAHVGCQIEEY